MTTKDARALAREISTGLRMVSRRGYRSYASFNSDWLERSIREALLAFARTREEEMRERAIKEASLDPRWSDLLPEDRYKTGYAAACNTIVERLRALPLSDESREKTGESDG